MLFLVFTEHLPELFLGDVPLHVDEDHRVLSAARRLGLEGEIAAPAGLQEGGLEETAGQDGPAGQGARGVLKHEPADGGDLFGRGREAHAVEERQAKVFDIVALDQRLDEPRLRDDLALQDRAGLQPALLALGQAAQGQQQ